MAAPSSIDGRGLPPKRETGCSPIYLAFVLAAEKVIKND